jgi:hypothetical protein
MGGVTKGWAVVLPDPLGQAQSGVQGRCCVATASSSCARAQGAAPLGQVQSGVQVRCCVATARPQDAYGKGSACSGACLQ